MMLAPHHHQPAHEHALSNMTASLAISSPVLPRISQPSSLQPSSYRPSRPKLTLNTSQSRSFGGKNTSLRLETLSAVSPTHRNTFINGNEAPKQTGSAFHFPPAPAPAARPTSLRLQIDDTVSAASNQADTNTLNSASTPATSTTSTSSIESATIHIPYKLAHNVKSILSNSPIPKRTPISSFAMSRPMFPQQKRVSFRAPLEEEITTTRYTLAHSDIESFDSESSGELSLAASTSSSSSATSSTYESTDSVEFSVSTSEASGSSPSSDESSGTWPAPISPANSASEHSDTPSLSLSTSSSSSSESTSALENRSRRVSRLSRIPRTGDKRDSSSESDSDSCPETPVAGRRKRRREWVWTLGDIQSLSGARGEETGSDDGS